jgi:RNA polymerase sigma factor (TIGR02999 family)
MSSNGSNAGDAEAREHLFTVLYDKLHRMAQRELRFHSSVTLGATTLLHETFLNLSQRESAAYFDRSGFLVYAARAMRGLVIDYLRGRQAQKRGSGFDITSLSTNLEGGADEDHKRQVEHLGEALKALERVDFRLAECVDLKFFCGLSLMEIARIRNVSERTVQRDWQKARVLLNRFMTSDSASLALDE